MERMVQNHRNAIGDERCLEGQIASVARVQDQSGYIASVTHEKGLPVLEEYNCPFIEVAKAHPEFCEAERQAYEKVLGRRPIHLDRCRASGAKVCRFCVCEKG